MGTVVGPPTRVSAADRDDDELVTGETRSKVAMTPSRHSIRSGTGF